MQHPRSARPPQPAPLPSPIQQGPDQISGVPALQAQLHSLLGTAVKRQEDQATRAKALHKLCALLSAQENAAAALPLAAAFWPRIQALLGDPAPAVRQTAAPALGLLGAIAARNPPGASLPAGLAPSTLFDWALPLLTGQAETQPDVRSQFWALTALREGLAAMDSGTVKRWAAAVFDACEHLLDSEDTSAHLLQPLLGVVTQAARHTPAIKARVRVLTDILLGWALDPQLPDVVRPAIASALVSFQHGWPPQPAFSSELVVKLTADMEALVAADSAPDVTTLRQFLGFSSCISAICRTCAASLHGIFAGFPEILQRFVTCLTAGQKRYDFLLSVPGSTQSTPEELCFHVDTMITVAANMPILSASQPVPDSSQTPPSAPFQLATVYPEVLDLILRLLHSSCKVTAGLHAPLRLHIRLLQLIDRQKGLLPLDEVARLLISDSPFTKLRQIYLMLLHHSQKEVSSFALHQMLDSLDILSINKPSKRRFHPNSSGPNTEGDKSSAASTGEESGIYLGLVRSEIAENIRSARFSLQIIEAAMQQSRSAECSRDAADSCWVALWAQCQMEGTLPKHSSLWLEGLKILRSHYREQLAPLNLVQGLHVLITSHTTEKACTAALEWLSDLFFEGKLRTSPGTAESITSDPDFVPRNLSQTIDAGQSSRRIADVTHTVCPAKFAKEDSSPGATEGPEDQSMTGSNVLAGPALAGTDRNAAASDPQEPQSRDLKLPAVALQAIIHAAGNKSEGLRLAAAQSVSRLVKHPGANLSEELVGRLVALAAERLTDLDEGVRDMWSGILSALATRHPVAEEMHDEGYYTPQWQADFSLKPQERVFKPTQLAQLISFLARGKASGSWDPGGNTDLWLLRLFSSCPLLPGKSSSLTARSFTSSAMLAWWAVQEAAKHLVTVRLRTHLGNPTQTFAALEKALQHALAAPAGNPADYYPDYRSAWLLLELVAALERNIHNAHEGCVERESLNTPILAFFTANRKVCEEWLARMRPLLLRLASAVDYHPAVLQHAFARLGELKSQLRALLTEPTLSHPGKDNSAQAAKNPTDPDNTAEMQPKLLLRRAELDARMAEEPSSARPVLTPAQRLAHDLNSTLKKAAAALVKEGDYSTVAGLHTYCMRSFAPLQSLQASEDAPVQKLEEMLAWLPGLQQLAAGRLEDAHNTLTSLLDNLHHGRPSTSDDALEFTLVQASEAYAAVADWQGLESFFANLEDLRAKLAADGRPRSAAALRLPSQYGNCQLALMSFERKEYGVSQSLLELSVWSDNMLTEPNKPFFPGKLPATGDSGIFRALLATETRNNSKNRWREEVRSTVTNSKEAALAPFRLAGSIGSSSFAQPLGRLRMLELLAERAESTNTKLQRDGLPIMELSDIGISPPHQLHADIAELELAPIYFAPNFPPLAAQIAWKLRVVAAVDPLATTAPAVATLERLSRFSAAAGNLKLSQRILTIAQQSPLVQNSPAVQDHLALINASISQRQGHTAEAAFKLYEMVQPIVSQVSGLEPSGHSNADSAAACLQLSNLTLDPRMQLDTSTVDLAEYRPLSTSIDKSHGEHLALLVSATKLAPRLATAWAALANWLHALLSKDAKQNGALWETIRNLAVTASCRRLSTAAVSHQQSMLAAPELLRILKLLEHGVDNAMQQQVQQIPYSWWQAVVPQLFSQLANPQEHMRKLGLKLLQQLEEVAPSAVLYPALAESNAKEGSPAWSLVERYRQQDPALVTQMEVLLEELGRITVLPNEQWHAILTELQMDVAKRVATTHAMATKLTELPSTEAGEERQRIMKERFVAVMVPAVIRLQRRLHASGILEPQTPHEAWFKKHYLLKLQDIVNCLQDPDDETVANPERAVETIRSLSKSIGASLNERSMKLSSVSPKLANLVNTAIPMPGMAAASWSAASASSAAGAPQIAADTGATVASFGTEIELLHTRTRPKKVVLVSSSGRCCTFLLKGREDLRLDARLLQVLRLTGSLLQHDPTLAGHKLNIRSFAVTPLGPRVGLIEWIESTKPLFQFFTDWQRNAAERAAAVKAEKESKGSQDQAPQKLAKPPPRAVDAFYTKLLPALKAAGIGRLASRREWPLEVLKQVLTALMREVPRSLLERQIWCGSVSSADWWRRQQSHSRSAAVMSMVGYLLGLGDRHLDNILLDRRSAEVVHIDYNIVFERGCKLPVPEMVPFRLTQTIQGALGPTGVEGTFRSTCEAALSSLRHNSQALLLMMEAILLDPLAEWAPDREDTAANQAMEMGVRLNLLCSRLDELKPALQSFLAGLHSVLRPSNQALSAFCTAFQPAFEVATVAHAARQESEMAQAKFQEARDKLREEWERAQAAAAERAEAQHRLEETRAAGSAVIAGYRTCSNRFKAVIAKLREPEVPELATPVEYWLSAQCRAPLGLKEPVLSLGGSVLSSLEGTSAALVQLPSKVVEDCIVVDQQAISLLQSRDSAVYACVASIKEYAQAAKTLLDGTYWQTAYHNQWLTAWSAMCQALLPEDFQAAREMAPTAYTGSLMIAWEGLSKVKLFEQPLPDTDAKQPTPLAILRADANAAEREVSMLRTDKKGSLEQALALVADTILISHSSACEHISGGEDLTAAFETALDAALAVAAHADASNDAIAGLPGLADLRKSAHGCVASVVALRTIWEVGRATFLPDLAGFCMAGFCMADTPGLTQEVAAAHHQHCAIEADVLRGKAAKHEVGRSQHASAIERVRLNEASVADAQQKLAATIRQALPPEHLAALQHEYQQSMERQQELAAETGELEMVSESLHAQEQALQHKAEQLSAKLGTSASSEGDDKAWRKPAAVAGLAGTLDGIYLLLKKLEAPLSCLAQEATKDVLPSTLQHWNFTFLCIDLLAKLTAAMLSTESQLRADGTAELSAPTLVLAGLDRVFSKAVQDIFVGTILPGLQQTVETLHRIFGGRSTAEAQHRGRTGGVSDAATVEHEGQADRATGNFMEQNQTSAAQQNPEHGTRPGTSPTVQRIADTLQKSAEAKAVLELAECKLKAREIAGVVAARQMWAAKQQAACEWLDQDVYDRAVETGSSQLEALKQQGVLDASLRGRAEIVRSLHVAVKSMQAAGEELETWRWQTSIPAEKQLYVTTKEQDSSQLPALKHFLALREQWFVLSQEQAATFQTIGQDILGLEASRDGRAWNAGQLDVDAFASCPPLIEALEAHSAAMHAADRVVAEARQASAVLQESAAEAVKQNASSTKEAGQAGAHFVTLAPQLVEAASRLPSGLNQLLTFLQMGDQPLEEALTVLDEFLTIAEGNEIVQDVHQSATQLHNSGQSVRRFLASLSSGLPSLFTAIREIELPTDAQLQQIVKGGASPELTAGAAALLDAVAPIFQHDFASHWPDLARQSETTRVFQTGLGAFRAMASAAASAIQQEHALLPEELVAVQATSTLLSGSQTDAAPGTAQRGSLQGSQSQGPQPPKRADGTTTPVSGEISPLLTAEDALSSVQSPSVSQPAGVQLAADAQIRNGLEQPGNAHFRSKQTSHHNSKAAKRREELAAARKAFADSTLRRFKARLQGLSEQGAKGQDRRTVVLTVEEQVEKLFQQATSLDNLAKMYEGWTPWI